MANKNAFLLTIFIVLINLSTVFSQSQQTIDADNAFANENYYSAIDLYKKAYAKEKDRVEKTRVIFFIAECYRLIEDPAQAEVWYSKAIKAQYPNDEAILRLAEALQVQGKFDEAIVEYNRFSAKNPGDKRAKAGLTASQTAQKWKDNPTAYEIDNMSLWNSKQSEFSPVYADKKFTSVVFTSTRQGSQGNAIDSRTGESFSDLYITKIDRKGKWSTPEAMEATINSPDNEGGATFDSKFSTMYFTRCAYQKNKEAGCKIYVSKKQGNAWGEAEELVLSEDDKVAIGHPNLSPDDMLLFFASDMPGGKGGKDIWYLKYDKKAKAWGEPINAGSAVNTDKDEMFPFMRDDGNLYFASNGHPGMGGFDIFRAEKIGEEKWGNVENLRSPINSSFNDFSIIFETGKDRGYFASDRPGGKGRDDIWSFKIPPIIFTLQGTVSDVDTKQPIKHALVKLVGTDGSSVEVKTDQMGFYMFAEKEAGERYINENTSYTILVSKQDYLNAKGQETTVGVEVSTAFVHDFVMQSIKKEEITFPEVLYDLGKYTLRPESKDSLDYLYQVLIDNPNIVIELSAHTDSRGSDKSNDILSDNRAKACVDYLVSKGIPSDRMVPKGYGERRLKITDDEIAKAPEDQREALHQKNRRTVFSVIRTDYVAKP